MFEAASDRITDRATPMAVVAVAVVAISTSAILVRWSTAPALVKAFYRVLFTTLLLAPLTVSRYDGTLRELSRRDLLIAAGTGVALAVHFASWFESLEWTTVAASVTLVQSQPIFVAIGATLLVGETVDRRIGAGIVVALVGITTMSASDASGAALAGVRPLYGNALAVLGAVMAAGYVLAGRQLRQRIALLPYVTVVYSVCAAVLFVFVVLSGGSLLSYPAREWLLFVGMAIGPGLLGHTLINWALEHVESSVVSVSLLGEPLGSTVLAVLLLSEVPTGLTIVGGAIVLAGIYLTATGSQTAGTP